MAGLWQVARKELLECIQMAGGHTLQIIKIHHMTSGDLLIRTQTEAAHQGLEEDTTWLEQVAPSATIKRYTYIVTAHSIQVTSMNTAPQSWAIEALLQQN